MPRHFLTLTDLGPGGLVRVLDASDEWKKTRGHAEARRPLAGKSIALVFEKASTRTRLSLEVAVSELGGHPVVLTSSGSQLGRGEPIADTARVLTRMVHAITFRTSSDQRMKELVAHATVPVLNALTDTGHPMQLLADLQTVRLARGKLEGLRYAWIGDGNNMANSWIEAAGLLGLELTLACPAGYDPDAGFLAAATGRGGKVRVVRDPREAIRGAHVVSTDVFASMGQESEAAKRQKAFHGFIVNRELLRHAAPDVTVLHCLPAHRGEEIEAEVIDAPNSAIWDQAEARLHTAKAALEWALGGDG
ncbi:MAG TPA: ornithine carbamoyltransferase [Polyangiaceae bacterium]|jgi:ornithine carbamoyltransferase|nr:ornithine carbamoyltransferase [Polyangiaceae bacterium]